MGSGSWSKAAYAAYSDTNNLTSRGVSATFLNTATTTANAINSLNINARSYNKNVADYQMTVGVRECRDSEEHPNTTPIIVAFDVTGSMGRIPHKMVNDLLPKLMLDLEDAGVTDPELLFMAFGDHLYDRAPIQVTQFESDTEKICKNLTELYLEGGGGGNDHESPIMAWIVAGYHTEIDSWYKRHKKGFLFTISDEGCNPDVTPVYLKKFMGYEDGCKTITAAEALEKAEEQYNVYHIHVKDGHHRYMPSWNEILGEHVIKCNSDDINKVISNIVIDKFYNKSDSVDKVESSEFKY